MISLQENKNNDFTILLNGDKLYSDGRLEVNVEGNRKFAELMAQEAKETKEKLHIIIDRPSLDISKISATNAPRIQKFIYRPTTLREYIGQEQAKDLIALNIRKIQQIKPVHFLISGSKGHGKTTLAYIVKNLLNAKMIERISKQITSNDDIVELINQINESTEKNVILFIDEVHSLDSALCEILYPVMEDFTLSGKPVKPFILIGATTEKHVLVKNNAPFIDRFQVQVELQHYRPEDIKEILIQYKNQLYRDYAISENFIDIVSKNSKRTPRIAISLLEDGIIESDVNHILKCHRIVFEGLTETDVSILRILTQNDKPMGAKALSQMIGISEKDYCETYENYLVEQEFILRTARGRTIATKGKEVYANILKRRNYASM
jgi:Holliday junction resolvasome RuvABC ATP-dependent DNA helicase subunit